MPLGIPPAPLVSWRKTWSGSVLICTQKWDDSGMSQLYDRTRLITLLQRDALRTGTFTLASGRSSHYYVDGRKVTLSAEGAALIGAGVLDLLEGHPGVRGGGGLTMGADPIVGATLAVAGGRNRDSLRGFLVRKEAKTHGTGNLVEGPLGAGAAGGGPGGGGGGGGDRGRRRDHRRLGVQGGRRRRGPGMHGGLRDRRARPPRRRRRPVRRARDPVPPPPDHPRPGRRAADALTLDGDDGPWSRACIAS